ncbi:DUF4870 domain-containing protein [Nocardia thailandica]|uniref:DUF4870 domain-containing protein n=1 Tax=Nocardia thailandica TaxID=257275 RepID=A0ABW6PVL9_9NOCA
MTSSQHPTNQSSGLDKKTSAILSYVLGWLSGLVFLFVGKNDPDVKFHAAQSVVFFGAVSVLNIALSVIGAVVGALVGALGIVFSLAGLALGVFTVVVWIMAIVQANNTGGARAELPLVGKFVAPYADRLAGSVG